MKIILAVLLTVFAATPALAEDWYRVAASERGLHYVDADSITRTGGVATGLENAIWREPTESGMVRATTRIEVNCADLSYRYRSHTFFDADGTSDTADGDGNLRRPRPGSSIEAVAGFICGRFGEAERLRGVTPEEDARRNSAAAAPVA